MTNYSFTDDPNTQTDDYLAKAAAVNDLISTIAGAMVSVVGVLAPIIVVLNPNVSDKVRLAALSGGAIAGGAGAAISRQQPKSLQEMAKDRFQHSAETSQEGEF